MPYSSAILVAHFPYNTYSHRPSEFPSCKIFFGPVSCADFLLQCRTPRLVNLHKDIEGEGVRAVIDPLPFVDIRHIARPSGIGCSVRAVPGLLAATVECQLLHPYAMESSHARNGQDQAAKIIGSFHT